MRPLVLRRLFLAGAAILATSAGIVLPATIAHAAGPTATFTKVSDWGTGWEGKYTVANGGTTAINAWTVAFDLPAGTTIGTFWDARLTVTGNHYSFQQPTWAGPLAPGASATFGFNGAGPGGPGNCTLNGAACGGGTTTPTVPGVPGAPTVTGVTSSSISLSWPASTGTVTGYRVYEGGTVVATVTATSATVGGLAASSSHTYAVAAYNAVGESAKSPPVTGTTTGGGTGVPGTPGNVHVTASADTSASLAWNAASGTVTGYRVYEGTTVRATVAGTGATVTGLAACTSHTYAVAAFNGTGESAKSAAVTATTTGCPTTSLPRHELTGYWQDFVNAATPLRLRDVPNEYDLVVIAFAQSTGTPGAVSFSLDAGLSSALGGYSDGDFRADVSTLHSRGKKVILSVGGETGNVSVGDATAATNFANSLRSILQTYGFDGVDIDLENGVNATFLGQALRNLRGQVGAGLIITMAPQTIDMQSTGTAYFQLALNIKDILTVVHTQYYNSGSMLGCDQLQPYSQGSVNFMTALACIQLENGLRPDQVALGLPAGTGAASGGVVSPGLVNQALDCLALGTNCGSFHPPHTYPAIRGAMTWSINWDVTNGTNFAHTVKPHLNTLP